MSQQSDSEALLEFMRTTINQKGKFDDDYFDHVRVEEKSDKMRSTEQWIPWKEAADKQGDEVLLELIDAKLHPRVRTSLTLSGLWATCFPGGDRTQQTPLGDQWAHTCEAHPTVWSLMARRSLQPRRGSLGL